MHNGEKMKFCCINCKNDKFQLIADSLRDSPNYKVVRCTSCSLVQLDHLPNVEEDQKFYDNDQQVKNVVPDLSLAEKRENAQVDINRRYEMTKNKISCDTSVLEIGCGYGFFVELLLQNGIDAEGIEISDDRRNVANTLCKNRIRNINLLMNEADFGEFPTKKFDVICLFQVLEHISKPELFLENIKNLYMHENSSLIIEVPNADDQMLSLSKEYSDFFWQRAHLVYYNKNTLEMILNKVGFSSQKCFCVQRYGLENAFNWIINKKPQLQKPVYESDNNLQWLEDYYKQKIEENFTADTLMCVVESNGN